MSRLITTRFYIDEEGDVHFDYTKERVLEVHFLGDGSAIAYVDDDGLSGGEIAISLAGLADLGVLLAAHLRAHPKEEGQE